MGANLARRVFCGRLLQKAHHQAQRSRIALFVTASSKMAVIREDQGQSGADPTAAPQGGKSPRPTPWRDGPWADIVLQAPVEVRHLAGVLLAGSARSGTRGSGTRGSGTRGSGTRGSGTRLAATGLSG